MYFLALIYWPVFDIFSFSYLSVVTTLSLRSYTFTGSLLNPFGILMIIFELYVKLRVELLSLSVYLPSTDNSL